MTLSLDEVRNIRFLSRWHESHRRIGYRASAVDNFMDQLEMGSQTL